VSALNERVLYEEETLARATSFEDAAIAVSIGNTCSFFLFPKRAADRCPGCSGEVYFHISGLKSPNGMLGIVQVRQVSIWDVKSPAAEAESNC
jgi:hypothetical protein